MKNKIKDQIKLESVCWVPSIEALENKPPLSVQAWLSKPVILSDALEKAYPEQGAIQIELLDQAFGRPYDSELGFLKEQYRGEAYFIRQVTLYNEAQVLTYGRVVIPPQTFMHNQQKIMTLGEGSFGKNILYSHPNYKRSAFEYASVNLPEFQTWGRRSIFWLEADPLIVTEVFLTDLGAYPEQNE